jgi:hypothetical protein
MAAEIFTDEEKLGVVERILDGLRQDGGWLPEAGDCEILKSICADFRARSPAAIDKAIDSLEFQVHSATRAKARLGYVEIGHYQAIGDRVLAHWPVIRPALEGLKIQAILTADKITSLESKKER